MKRSRMWLVWIVVLIAIIGLGYEVWTRGITGWLRGEAFFEGKPTSYWRAEIDDWADHFGSPERAVLIGICGYGSGVERSRRDTSWQRFRVAVNLPKEPLVAPAVVGYNPDAEHVLKELAREEKYQWLVERVRLRRVLCENHSSHPMPTRPPVDTPR